MSRWSYSHFSGDGWPEWLTRQQVNLCVCCVTPRATCVQCAECLRCLSDECVAASRRPILRHGRQWHLFSGRARLGSWRRHGGQWVVAVAAISGVVSGSLLPRNAPRQPRHAGNRKGIYSFPSYFVSVLKPLLPTPSGYKYGWAKHYGTTPASKGRRSVSVRFVQRIIVIIFYQLRLSAKYIKVILPSKISLLRVILLQVILLRIYF